MADSGDHRFEEAWYDDLYHCDFVKFESSTWARNEGQPGEGRMVRGETRRIELKKNSITRLHQLEAESAGETRNEFQAVRVGFQRLPDELHVLWSSTPHPPFSRNYWQEHNDLRILAEARALACKAGRLLVAVRGPDEPKQTNVKSAPGPERLIRKVGDVWQLAFGWRFAYIKDLKGLVYILYLIQASNRKRPTNPS